MINIKTGKYFYRGNRFIGKSFIKNLNILYKEI